MVQRAAARRWLALAAALAVGLSASALLGPPGRMGSALPGGEGTTPGAAPGESPAAPSAGIPAAPPGLAPSQGAPNPSVRVLFWCDLENTRLLGNRFVSFYAEQESGWRGLGFDVRQGVQDPPELLHGGLAGLQANDFMQMELGFFDPFGAVRLFYLSAELTIPAHGSVTVCAEMEKTAQLQIAGEAEASGYSFATTLGSNLDFSGQTARLVNAGGLQIAAQNFGFELPGGLLQVTLDPAQPRYYIRPTRCPAE